VTDQNRFQNAFYSDSLNKPLGKFKTQKIIKF